MQHLHHLGVRQHSAGWDRVSVGVPGEEFAKPGECWVLPDEAPLVELCIGGGIQGPFPTLPTAAALIQAPC